MDSRPFKLDADEVNYREAMDDDRCDKCIHFYERKIDGYTVCEVLRDVKTDDEEYSIKPDWVCQFFTSDGDHFPLYEGEIPKHDEDDERPD